jgi:hypothetical protein
LITQSTNAVLMVRPGRFYPNPETAADNSFQKSPDEETADLTSRAQAEFDRAVATLRGNGITVHVMEDTVSPEKPDAVFPNNWLSTHFDGRVVIYPMYAVARRRERRWEVIDELRKHYRVDEVIDYSACETQGECLEGTGSLVLDHVNRTAYVSFSKRAHPNVLRRFCADFGYEPVTFTSVDASGQPVYHTNVVMCIGTKFALAGLEMIAEACERKQVRERLVGSARALIELSAAQIAEFAGNAIELQNESGEKLVVISRRGLAALGRDQRQAVERFAQFVPLDLPTIELAGGSARCMLATIHLPRRAG